ncbi:cold-regulated protein 27-like [Andrographis paniculata]|uniref:cold-regulated protein 27-like n=1 Tax=Andrographis paniculata TaxID=175694 RepID=UPI0021E7645E|nr:cold-regulated protein 27-like [Andrographis paniculata]
MENSGDSNAGETRNCYEQEESSTWAEAEKKPAEWTDEKHSLYLKSMEAAFVNHLYKLLAQQSHKNFPLGSKPSRHKPTGTSAPSGQYKVFRYGCWSKLDFMREEPEVNQVKGSGVLTANPWIRHYKCSEGKGNRRISSKAASEKQNSQHSDDGDTEVTDQNFRDNDLDEEKSEMMQGIKRTRTSTDTVSNTDQVVPSESIIAQDSVTGVHGNED